MFSSVRQPIGCVLFLLALVLSSPAQPLAEKVGTCSISGKITLQSSGLAGVTVLVRTPYDGMTRSVQFRATTDANGYYRIKNLPAGTYDVTPIPLAYVLANEQILRSYVLRDGENIEDANFVLMRGGVITGKITDNEGRPLINAPVTLAPVDAPVGPPHVYHNWLFTDDRGIYRAFGIKRGKYKVYAGGVLSRPRTLYPRTFYPSVSDPAKATIIEVTEGGEVSKVDIVVGPATAVFTVSGKVVDSETGRPLPHVKFGLREIYEGGGGGQTTSSDLVTDKSGSFLLESVTPGKYSVFVLPDEVNNINGEGPPFEVVDDDVDHLVVTVSRAASVSGFVILEGGKDLSRIRNFGPLDISALLDPGQFDSVSDYSSEVKSDGSFKITGLPGGTANFALSWQNAPQSKQLGVVRIERNGIVQPGGISLKNREQVTGVRLIARQLTGAIRGLVKAEGDEALRTSEMTIWLDVDEKDQTRQITLAGIPTPQLDSRGRFYVDGLGPGVYEVKVGLFTYGQYDPKKVFTEKVVVTDNAVTEVTVKVKLPE